MNLDKESTSDFFADGGGGGGGGALTTLQNARPCPLRKIQNAIIYTMQSMWYNQNFDIC